MGKNDDVYRQILDLAETTREGIDHINRLTIEGRFEETMELYTDVVSSVHETKKALVAFWPGYEGSELEKKTEAVVDAIKLMLNAYEGDRDVRPMEVLQFSLAPAYSRWKKALEETLGAECLSSYH